MKLLLTLVVAILFINSPGARNFTAGLLNTAADIVDTNWSRIVTLSHSPSLTLINTMTAQSPNADDLFALKENYINHIIDGMDMDSLCQMCFDLLLDAYNDCTWDELQEEIVDLYDEDTLVNLLPVEENK